MIRTTHLLSAFGLLALGCGVASHEAHDPHADIGDLASCMDTVPAEATHCRLDLGTGVDSHWSDSDGVDPGTAGCHYEYADATCGEPKDGRTFGELCLDDDRLVESNPRPGTCHTHAGDHGRPDVVSCSDWCRSQGSAAGRCESGIEASGDHGACQSARCACDA